MSNNEEVVEHVNQADVIEIWHRMQTSCMPVKQPDVTDNMS